MSLSAPSKPRLGEEEWLMKRPASRGFTSVRIGASGRGIRSQDGNQKAAPTVSQFPLFSLAKKWPEPWKSPTFLHFLQQQLLNFQTFFSIASLNLEKVRHSYTNSYHLNWAIDIDRHRSSSRVSFVSPRHKEPLQILGHHATLAHEDRGPFPRHGLQALAHFAMVHHLHHVLATGDLGWTKNGWTMVN